MSDRVYLDFNATTPLAREVVAAIEPYLSQAYGNPSSAHWAGAPARDAVETARCQVAGLLCCDATEIVFTSGGSEANNLALKGVFFARPARNAHPHFVVSQIEHPAILEPCRFLERLGAEVSYVRVDRYGLVDPEDVRRAIRPSTLLVSIMHANNEVGTIQPIEEIARLAHEAGALMHTDAAQTVGKIAVDVESLGVDLLSIAGHKLYGPKGVGALYIREGVAVEPLVHGAPHEAARRAGTENVLEVVGLGAACDLAARTVDAPRITRLRDEFWNRLRSELGDGVVLNGHPSLRLPNTLNVSLVAQVGGEVLARMPRVAASTGAACHAGRQETSAVLRAMGVGDEAALGAIRFSLGRTTSEQEIDFVVDELRRLVRR